MTSSTSGRVAGKLEDERAGVRGRPVVRPARSDRPGLRAPRAGLAPRRRRPVRASDFDRDDRAACPSAAGGPRSRPAPARRRPCRRSDPRAGSRGRVAAPRERGRARRPRGSARPPARSMHPVLELDLDRPRRAGRRSRARIQRAGAGARPPRQRRRPSAVARASLLEHLERVDRARRGPRASSVRTQVASGWSCHERRSSASMTSTIPASRAARLGVLDRDDRLDPPVEVAVHQVGRADVPLAVAAVVEAPDPRVLEELADDRADPDALGHARHARLERAGAADDRSIVDAGLRRAGRAPRSTGDVDDRVELEDDPRRRGRPARAPTSRSTSSRNRERRLCGATSSRRNVRWRDRPVRTLNRSVTSAPISGRHGQQAEVDVQAGGLRVVVAGPDVDVAAQPGALAADDERGLASAS